MQFVDFFYPVRALFVVTHESSVWHTALWGPLLKSLCQICFLQMYNLCSTDEKKVPSLNYSAVKFVSCVWISLDFGGILEQQLNIETQLPQSHSKLNYCTNTQFPARAALFPSFVFWDFLHPHNLVHTQTRTDVERPQAKWCDWLNRCESFVRLLTQSAG